MKTATIVHFETLDQQFKIIFQNIQSIYNKQHLLEAFINDKPTYKAICMCETWLTKDKLETLQFSGYKTAASYCRRSRSGGGVCIILEDHIECIECCDIGDMTIEYCLEVCACKLPKQNLIIVTLYWNRREEEVFISQLKQIMHFINNKYKKFNVIIGGDFNLNILENSTKTNNLINLMLEYKFVQHIKEPTRISQTTSTCLDLIFTNFNDNNMYTTVEELGFSDHSGTIIHMILKQQTKNSIWFANKRLFNQSNIKKFKSKLNIQNWNNIIQPNKNVNENYQSFHNILTEILDECIPKRRLKLKTKHNNYWLTVGIKQSCKNKRLLKILSLKTNNSVLTKYYKKYEKILKKSVITAKKLHNINKINKSTNKVKTMWNIVKERTNKKIKIDKENITLQTTNPVSEPKQVANIFNNFFASIGENIIQSPGFVPRETSVMNPTENTMFLTPVDGYEVNKILKNLKNKNSHGIDELPPTLFRQCADELTLPFYKLINQSFEEGIFPNQLKKALIKPIHKKNAKTDPNNYRPIALLPTASKVFEKAMCSRVYSFCEKYKIFDDCQNGFRKNRSTTLAVYKYIQEALNIINNKQYAIGILLDMTKAYDKVQFKILLNKLYGIGIRGKAHDWFASYLKGREQLVEIEYYNKKTKETQLIRSDVRPIHASIPQGSVIGCLLFLIYINDLPKTIDGPCVLFADDISLLTSCQTNANLNEKLTTILNKTLNWMSEHNLEINFTKTKIITFHPWQKNRININFTFNQQQLEVVNDFTLLGLTIDTHINWKTHIQKVKSKISKFSYALREIKKTTNLQTALVTYYAYAHAWFSYGIILWGNSTDAPSLFTLQKKLIRIITNIEQTDSCKPYFQKHKILTLISIYILELCKLVRNYPDSYETREKIQTKYSLRHKNRLNLPTSRLKLHSSSPYAMSIKIYNKLPENIKQENKTNLFLKKLKQFLITKSYYTIEEYLTDKCNNI